MGVDILATSKVKHRARFGISTKRNDLSKICLPYNVIHDRGTRIKFG
jgi:hypothetical protein